MAVYNSTGLDHYRHSDWLGSARLDSTPTRTVLYDVAYGPYGEAYAQSGTADLSFTSMNQDTVSNLYDFPAREYGIQGRWPSPDPAGIFAVNPGDPQSWNRYAYVRNNPLAITDPTGLCGDDTSGSTCVILPGDPPDPCFASTYSSCVVFPTYVYLGPITITSFGPLATVGTPPTFPTGPGIDYSAMPLLRWAFSLPDPCDPSLGLASPCILDVTSTTINGNINIIGSGNGDVLPNCAYSGATDYCTTGPALYWNSGTGQWQETRPPMSPYQTFFSSMNPDQKRMWFVFNNAAYMAAHPFTACQAFSLTMIANGIVSTPTVVEGASLAEKRALYGGRIGVGLASALACN